MRKLIYTNIAILIYFLTITTKCYACDEFPISQFRISRDQSIYLNAGDRRVFESTSYDPDDGVGSNVGIVQWEWSIDGAYAGSNDYLDWTFYNAGTGTHTVQLWVLDNDGQSALSTICYIYVYDDYPVPFISTPANFTSYMSYESNPITFDGSYSYDPDNDPEDPTHGIAEYEWGLWNYQTSTFTLLDCSDPSFIFDPDALGLSPGLYAVDLLVWDDENNWSDGYYYENGYRDIYVFDVSMHAENDYASIKGHADMVCTPLGVSGGTYSWTMIDGPGTLTFWPSSSSEEPDITASQTGTYHVRVGYTIGGETAYEDEWITFIGVTLDSPTSYPFYIAVDTPLYISTTPSHPYGTYEWVYVGGGPVGAVVTFLPNNESEDVTFSANQGGAYLIRVEYTIFGVKYDQLYPIYVIDVDITTPSSFPTYWVIGTDPLQLDCTPYGSTTGTYSWSQVQFQGSGEGTITFSNPSIKNPTIEIDQPGDYKVKVEYTKNGTTVTDISGIITAIDVDLDIDSDNNNGTNGPSRDQAEDNIEEYEGYPGKLIAVNDEDIDNDCIPNFADGFDKYDNQGANAGGNFTPIILGLNSTIDLQQVKISFIYNESNPDAVVRTGSGTADEPYIYTPASGKLRLWKLNGNQDRKKAEVNNNGDYIKSESIYSPDDLDFGTSYTKTLYVEGIDKSASPGDELVTVQIDPDGSGPAGWVCSDQVRVSLLKVDIDGDGNHDGTITDTPADDAIAQENRSWGIITLCNMDDDNSDGIKDYYGDNASTINSGQNYMDYEDMAPIILRKLPLLTFQVPSSWHLNIRVSQPSNVPENTTADQVVRLFSKRDDGASVILGPGTNNFPVPLTAGHQVNLTTLNNPNNEEYITMAIEGLGGDDPTFLDNGIPYFAGEVKLTVELTYPEPGSPSNYLVFHSDEITVKVAPLLLLSHSNDPIKSYVSYYGESLERQQYCYTDFPNATPILDDYVITGCDDLWAQDEFQICYQEAPYHSMYVAWDARRGWDLDNFVKTLLAPDFAHMEIYGGGGFTQYSFGNLEVSTPILNYPLGRIYYGNGMDETHKEFLIRQKVQLPVELDTSWLLVEHVDELMTFTPDGKVLLADPQLAINLLKPQGIPLNQYIDGYYLDYGFNTNTISGLLSKMYTLNPGIQGQVSVEEYNLVIVDNIINGDGGFKDDIKSDESGFGLDDSDIISVPVLFLPPSDQSLALTPDLVNGAVYGDTYISPNSFLANDELNEPDMPDPFNEYLEDSLQGIMSVIFIDDWIYHANFGEVHCSQNEQRQIPTGSNQWWTIDP